MRYFKDNDGRIFAFEVNVDSSWVEGLEEIEKETALAAVAPTSEAITADLLHRRAMAYADPITGSDRLFAEAVRMREMGESGWEDVREQAVTRYQQIKEQVSIP